MKKNIHPKYQSVSVICSCGNKVNIFSTINKRNLHLDICSSCHPFYTGKQRVVSRGGRIEKFNKKFSFN
ncbi:50S ribosomal protein L31 [Buchnera aphidicola]|uniref:Large ribosomal subunit protein bL31 n=1 Tax=Buchnera aphidicola (Stegophylla sp.) TaxID=2315800 RepID=A0A4D6YLJ1_9GAMM|nr:50S ribosomal protein L31 [Buchnera aphidicola (Stegophylla sp.)]QCI26518.1 50S ribosomal protein L31 [Buchnera aphidicola (Stegophylla sp.)]